LPVVEISLSHLKRLVGGDVEEQRLLEELPYVGLDIEGQEEDRVRVEYSPNRPDLGTVFGIARALRGLLGLQEGPHDYPLLKGSVEVIVHRGLEGVRPHIACAVARGLRLNDEALRQLIGLQEDLHRGLGRGRRLASIGLHDLSPLRPPIHYEPQGPEFRFIPLGQSAQMSLQEVLSRLEQGRAYGALVPPGGPYPILRDEEGQVLSFPPIINGVVTQLTESTTEIFVDVTGTSRAPVESCLNIIATTLAEMGGRLETVLVKHPQGAQLYPDLSPREERVDIRLINGLLGLKLTPEAIRRLLLRQGFGVRSARGGIVALVPAYRCDVLHPVDLAEEVALAYHYGRLKPLLPSQRGLGRPLPRTAPLAKLRELLLGLGFLEVVTPTLVSRELAGEGALELEHSKSAEHSYLRTSLLFPLLEALSRNRHVEYPQRLFEIGRVFPHKSEELHLGLVVAEAKASFSSIASVIERLNALLFRGLLSLRPYEASELIRGRAASLYLEGQVGLMGEVAPQLLERFGLPVPVAYAELHLDALLQALLQKV